MIACKLNNGVTTIARSAPPSLRCGQPGQPVSPVLTAAKSCDLFPPTSDLGLGPTGRQTVAWTDETKHPTLGSIPLFMAAFGPRETDQ